MVKQKILCILLVFILMFGVSISSFASNINSTNNQQTSNNPLENLNQQKEETQEKLEEANSKLEYVQTEMSNTLVQIQELDDKIRQYEHHPFVGTGHLQLLVAKIAYAHLHQRPDARGLVQRIVHDRRMRISEALVSFAQVGMRIDMQDADAGIPPGHRPD